ncbi:hypothetical protein KL86PLE_130477 [uncultured Pleomorphomonas sp.]|uniref:Uncharacterized protein n=1 Tax=uncultured Pleomorphomonas sp. TaxID=442121 RepID=A0A212LBZ3_9HYPH|nr:hypothetical protein KL86PLE_130477 [uncultured Pleomorphomonas sp.]
MRPTPETEPAFRVARSDFTWLGLLVQEHSANASCHQRTNS